jgi:alpha-1,6-mannosyltransferase
MSVPRASSSPSSSSSFSLAPALSASLHYLPLALAILYALAVPFAKVEESFALQAAHDFLALGPANLAHFDHLAFPGVVPRSCLGAAALALAALPAKAAAVLLRAPRLCLQAAVRCALAAGVGLAYARVLDAAAGALGARTARGAALAVALTPHYLFYASRTLPNTFASALVLLALADWLRMPRLGAAGYSPAHLVAAVAAFVAAVVVFRCDMVVLLGCVALSWLAARRATLPQLLGYGVPLGAAALAATVAVDSWFWRRALWPEGVVLFFNTVQNRSSEYGVSPWHWYWTSALPRAMLGTLVFVAAAVPTMVPVAGKAPAADPCDCAEIESPVDAAAAAAAAAAGGDAGGLPPDVCPPTCPPAPRYASMDEFFWSRYA